MNITLYNTRTRQLDVFTPSDPKNVGLYSCGPTVYHYAHIGNLRTYIFVDILKRVLTYAGFTINHVMNITDVGHLTSDSDTGDDKMEKGAKRENMSVWDIAKRYTQAFKKDIHRLNIIEPSIWCKATDNIQEQIAQIQTLEKKGLTYRLEDGIYYDTAKFPRYGDFAKLDIQNLQAGIRVELVKGKKNPTDFALWKFSKKNEKRQMEWPSPWGVGFPGWHIECSAMSMKYLGNHFDIHCGGVDHIQVHHTNEIAQAEGILGSGPWVKYWLHGEFMVISKDEKMSKSGDNFLTLQSLIDKEYNPLAYRFMTYQTHYRKQLQFTFESLQAAQNGFISLKQKIQLLDTTTKKNTNTYKKQFEEAIAQDLNMPKALAVLQTLISDATLGGAQKRELITHMDTVFGLDLLVKDTVEIPIDIQVLLTQRTQAKSEKNFKRSDELRTQIQEAGFVLKDNKDGTQTLTKR